MIYVIVVLAGIVAAVVVGAIAKFAVIPFIDWLIDLGDPFAGQPGTGKGTEGLGTRPPEIAHEGNPFAPRFHDELTGPAFTPARPFPHTSPAGPAAPPPPADYTGAEPGTAAAAGGVCPQAPPPPLPDPAWAAANPGAWPFTWMLDDQFTEALDVIQKAGAP